MHQKQHRLRLARVNDVVWGVGYRVVDVATAIEEDLTTRKGVERICRHAFTFVKPHYHAVVKLEGEFVWHSHPETEELFWVETTALAASRMTTLSLPRISK